MYTPRSTNEYLLTLLITVPESDLEDDIRSKCQNLAKELKTKPIDPERLRDFLIQEVYEKCQSVYARHLLHPEHITSSSNMRLN